MVETNGRDSRKTKCFKIHWSIYAVLLAFCIKKAKYHNPTEERRKKTTISDKTRQDKILRKETRPRHPKIS